MKAYKGFNRDMTCRGFKYEEGKEYKEQCARVCDCGFHACEHPLDCFSYYAPGESVYHEVELGGSIDKGGLNDTNVAATEIKVGARLSIAGLVKAAIDYTFARIKPEVKADEERGAASATGDRGAASAGHETAVAVAWGIECTAKGVQGAHLVLADWRYNNKTDLWELHGAKMVRVDGKQIKPDTWYGVRGGKVVKVQKED